jgi:hypothetical protein
VKGIYCACGTLEDQRHVCSITYRKLETALRTIQQWDCLNPPRPELLADLPWLKRVVDEALTQSDAASKHE